MKPDKPTLEREGDINRKLSARVRLQLRIADINQTAAAKALGYARPTLGQRLRGKRSLTGADLVRIARLTGTNVVDLFPEDLR
ncbi:helix-turn-helix domain-containing protein [Rhodococcus hoagii]|nr:helix-turn-helix domain-containing protein [Prescottella equi]MBM4634470.1 helix-turn-helix domain-containing protein [Prescottella equi]NKR24056.1 helix-turn-helix domain-containing protein [Prescottella equi]NKR28519.1 helix-turn-helix domain-containing protein [Prescottella equi]